MDATCQGYDFGVLFIVDYLEGIEWLRQHKFVILGIVCDVRGLAQALSRYKVQ